MSEEQLKAFLEKVKGDTSLEEKINAAADADAVVAIAKAAGFVISAENLKQVRIKLLDEELEMATGGGCSPWSVNSVGTFTCYEQP